MRAVAQLGDAFALTIHGHWVAPPVMYNTEMRTFMLDAVVRTLVAEVLGHVMCLPLSVHQARWLDRTERSGTVYPHHIVPLQIQSDTLHGWKVGQADPRIIAFWHLFFSLKELGHFNPVLKYTLLKAQTSSRI